MSFSSSPVIKKVMKSESMPLVASSSGNEKKVFDAVKSLVNLLKDWEDQHITGKLSLASILKLKESLGWKLDNLPVGPKMDFLLETCNKLGAVLDRMNQVAHDLQTLAQQLAVLSNLQQFQSQKSTQLPVFPSGTWNFVKFGAVFQTISDAFHDEIKVLTIIKESAAQAPDKSSLTSYIARWNNPACFSTRIIMLINGLLIESSLYNL